MRKLLLIFLIALFAGQVSLLFSQDIPEILKQRDEIYFTFNIQDRSEISTLTRIISIDNVMGNQVWAYANTKEYLKFMQLGYDITVLPSPGLLHPAEIKEQGPLGPLTVWNFYPTYTQYESFMAQFQANYPTLCNLDTIGTLASGRRLLVLKISDNVNTDETEPEFFYSSTMHGDETTGFIMMLHLADYLLSNYGTNPEATELVNNLEIYICPNANPDGTYYPVGNNTISAPRRSNNNGYDLNRNYPDFVSGTVPTGTIQPETNAFMNFATQRHFVMGANFHGGIEVVNYPWDTWATLHADDNWFYFTSREYADTVHLHAPSTYMTALNNGITNGYAWYEADGTRQDYMNYYHHCFETTIEISNTKNPPASQLLSFWDYNWRSLIHYLKEARYGIHGIITDQVTGLPVEAKVFVVGHDINNSFVYSSAGPGDYHRLIKAGTYTLEISAPCYQTQTISNVVVTDHATVTLNIQLVPGPAAAVTTSPVTAITMSGASCGGNVTCTGQTPVTARGVCWGTAANPVVTGNHTVNGTGAGTFTSTITGLSPNTTYHVRAYVTNNSGTYYGSDVAFTTLCGTITAFPYTQGFENSGQIPNCWTQEQVNNSGVNWTFTTGNGGSYPSTAHSGTYNALLKDNTSGDNKTRLIAPPLDLSGVPSPQLKFWHYQAIWSGDQDQLAIYYKTAAGGTWTQITTYASSVTTWTQRTIPLPNPSATYFIAFEGNAKYGYGVCLDDVEISTSCNPTYPVSLTISASANPVTAGTQVTFTATPVNGGTTPAYQWKVNAGNVSNATNSTYTYTPSDGDVVSCVLTSSQSCATGNPATSNAVTLTVYNIPASLSLTGAITGTECSNAQQTITVAGNDNLYTVDAGADVTMIAGENILFYPGTTIVAGGYLFGYIAPSGPWCPQTDAASATDAAALDIRQTGSWMVYPNPTTGDFTIMTDQNFPEKSRISIYNMKGFEVLKERDISQGRNQFSLAGLPAGLYLIRVTWSGNMKTGRIIKTE